MLPDLRIGPAGECSLCPLWVISGHMRRKKACPLYPRKRTCALQLGMSALGQKRTFPRCQIKEAARGKMTLISANSPGCVSTSIEPPDSTTIAVLGGLASTANDPIRPVCQRQHRQNPG